jgi:hypothetical protein
MVSIEA